MVYVFDEMNCFSDEDFNQYITYASDNRKTAIDRYRFMQNKKESLLVFLLLRVGLFMEYGIMQMPEFSKDSNGKPFLNDNQNSCFNFSHCVKGVVCAISKYSVGTDIQNYENCDIDFCKMILSENEFSTYCKNGIDVKNITKIWTLKESYGKMSGMGIRYDLKSTDFASDITGWHEVNNILFYSKLREEYVFSICSHEPLEICSISYDQLKTILANVKLSGAWNDDKL